MKSCITFSSAVLRLIPFVQCEVTMDNTLEFIEALDRLEASLNKCPKIGETDGMKEHPAIFHYFYGSSDFYICEYDRGDEMFGYAILGGDLQNSEWGYFSRYSLVKIPQLNIDYHFEEQTIEAALYTAYPNYFKKPLSLEQTPIDKNDPLPETYRNYPYQYTKVDFGVILRKNNKELFLSGDDKTLFFMECNRAKQHGRSISDVIENYFIN
jgi:hypothetical protein